MKYSLKHFFVCIFIIFNLSNFAFGFRILDPHPSTDYEKRYGKSPNEGPPFCRYVNYSQYYYINDTRYNNHSSAVTSAFTSWNNVSAITFSSTTSTGIPLETYNSTQGYPGIVNPGKANPVRNSNYQLVAGSSDVQLNTFHTWLSNGTQDLTQHNFDVETILLHEVGHIHSLAHPETDDFSQDATAPIMAGGDNVYFHTNVAQSLRSDDSNGISWIDSHAMFPEHFSSMNSAFSNISSQGKVWATSGSRSVSSNVTIADGKNLTVQSGCTLNLGSNKVVVSNGSITLESGSSVSPYIVRKIGSTVKGLYSDIASAVTDASWGQTIEVKGAHSLSSDLTIPYGVILKPMSGSEMKFASGKKLIVNGTLNADNATFTKSGTSAWYGIVYETTGSGTIQNSEIKNASYGIYCKSSYPNIENNTFSGNNYALYIYSCSPDIESNEVTNDLVYLNNCNSYMVDNYFNYPTGSYAIKFYGSSPNLYDHTIDGGVVADNGSEVYFGGTPGQGYNQLDYDGTEFTVKANNSSDIILGYGDAGPYYAGYNTILAGQNALGEAYASSNSQIDAEWCWWGQATPPSLGSNISTDHALSTNPGGGSSLAKSASYSRSYDYIVELPFDAVADSMLKEAHNMYRNKNSEGAKGIYKSVIKQFPNMHYAHKALFQLLRMGKEEKSMNMKGLYEELLKDVDNTEISVAIRTRMVSNDRKEKDFITAISRLETVIEQFPKTSHEYYALFDLFNIYQKDLKDYYTAEKILMEMIEKFPDEEYTLMAQFDADNTVEGYENYQEYKEQVDLVKDTEGVNLFDAYPNPFNPETTISYILPEQSNVTIRIYDLAGNLVKTLVNERNKPQGCYNVVWNATDMSSGVYFYQITAGSISQVKKCLLIK